MLNGIRHRRPLAAEFEQLLIGEQAFLEPGITLTELARRLYTNKTYLSRLVNSHYGLPFPDLLASLRTESAKRYLAGHPGARMETVARVCGFSGAPAFLRCFRKVTGTTPRGWITL